jgi:transcriptional regulator with PAS, ATPase and Fis domain
LDRLSKDRRAVLESILSAKNIHSIFTLPIPTYKNDEQNCPLCKEERQLNKHFEEMGTDSKEYVRSRKMKISVKEIPEEKTVQNQKSASESTITRGKALAFLYNKGDIAFLEALRHKTPLNKLMYVLDAIPPEYIRINDVHEWMTETLSEITNIGHLTKLVRMWMNVHPQIIIENLEHILVQFAKSGRNRFPSFVLEYLIFEGIIEKFDLIKKIEEIKNKQTELSEFFSNILDSGLYRIPKEFYLRPSLNEFFDNILNKIAPKDVNVLITGETGTGKSLLGRLIHDWSSRSKKNFIDVDIAHYPETLLESALFGHEKGAFTGADKSKKGEFEIVNGGTIFLDEIGNINLSCQSKLLTVIEKKEYKRIGGESPINVDFRLICATNEKLEELVQKGLFREDLYFRLSVINIKMPALRETPDDIKVLANHFAEFYCDRYNVPKIALNSNIIDMLKKRQWRGNVRELQNVIESSVVFSDNGKVNFDSFDQMVIYYVPKSTKKTEENTFEQKVQKFKKQETIKELEKHNWNITKTAKAIGITRKTLYKRMEKNGISEDKK